MHPAVETFSMPDWGHMPAAAVQAMGQRCCPASRAKLRQVCSSWHNALASQFAKVYVGPGSPWPGSSSAMEEQEQDAAAAAATEQRVAALRQAFPGASTLHVSASSTRDYPASYTQDLARLLSGLPGLTSLSLLELAELEDVDNLDPASLWDALQAALPLLRQRLVSLSVAGCFWNDPGLFGVLRHLTALTQLRLANNPLETACEVGIIAGMSQLRVLEFGLIFDGASQHADVPRALAALGDLQQLQELSLPMWRRSLGGRAHPLAPALSAALGRLSQLTSLAVDGKFGHLRVVSCLTNLRRLASAAPLSVEGWQAISQLPQLTLLTSLTPPSEPLRLNPARPHPGLDLGLLAPRGSLAGLDVGLLQPEHLASLGQFTCLQQLNLRCGATFQQARQQAQVLTALSCLPGSLTSLQLGPMLPLSAELLATVAHSCPSLLSLTARFTHVAANTAAAAAAGEVDAAPMLRGPGAAAAAAAGLRASAESGEGVDVDMFPGHSVPGADVSDADAVMVAHAGGAEAVDMQFLADGLTQDCSAAAAGGAAAAVLSLINGSSCSSLGISRALRRLQGLRSLELTLLGEDDDEEDHVYAGSSGGGAYRVSNSGDKLRMLDAGVVTSAATPSRPWAQLLVDDLPKGLQHLALAGPWLLSMSAAASAAAAVAAGSTGVTGGLPQRHSSATRGQSESQLRRHSGQPCTVCGRMLAAPAVSTCSAAADAAAGPAEAAAAQQQVGSQGQLLCECMKGLCGMQLTPPQLPQQPALSTAAAFLAVFADLVQQQQQQQQEQQQGGSGSPLRQGRPGSGLKRPGSHTAVLTAAATESCGRAQNHSQPGRTNMGLNPAADSAAASVAAAAGVDVFKHEQWGGLEKRTRSSLDPAAAAAAAAPGAARDVPTSPVAQLLPALVQLSLFKCHVSWEALEQLVKAAGTQLHKLLLLQVYTNSAAALAGSGQQGTLPLAARAAAAGAPAAAAKCSSLAAAAAAGAVAPRAAAVPSRLGRASAVPTPGLTAAWVAPAEMTTQQLMTLPVAWPHLQEWHLHPHQLWGMVRAGCFASTASSAAAAATAAGSGSMQSSSSGSDSIMQQQQQLLFQPDAGGGQLLHASQLLNLRHLYIVNRPAAFAAEFPSVKERRQGEAITCLPLHHRPSLAALLAQLQLGLQQLPALRQLLLYLGHVARQRPDLPDACGDELWSEAGERLLEVLPAVRVKHYKPSLVTAGSGGGGGETAGLEPVAGAEDVGARCGGLADDGMECVAE